MHWLYDNDECAFGTRSLATGFIPPSNTIKAISSPLNGALLDDVRLGRDLVFPTIKISPPFISGNGGKFGNSGSSPFGPTQGGFKLLIFQCAAHSAWDIPLAVRYVSPLASYRHKIVALPVGYSFKTEAISRSGTSRPVSIFSCVSIYRFVWIRDSVAQYSELANSSFSCAASFSTASASSLAWPEARIPASALFWALPANVLASDAANAAELADCCALSDVASSYEWIAASASFGLYKFRGKLLPPVQVNLSDSDIPKVSNPSCRLAPKPNRM